VSFLGGAIFAVASLSIGQDMPIVHEPPLILGQGFLQSLRQANKQFNLDDDLCVRLLSDFGAVDRLLPACTAIADASYATCAAASSFREGRVTTAP
jgi:hypothetical protein